MASFGGQQENYSNNPAVESTSKRAESREGSAERKASKDREEKLKYARDRQNEERQRKIEELRAQAEAAQRYREQKEEERRRRIEEIRVRDTEKRHQVEERKKAIIEAEKERREYILKKNQERESRIEVKKRDRNSIGFAFGSSTPRLLDVPADYGLVSPSTFWGQRRSTSISNVAGASLSRRSSERELADSGVKKRASSSTDRNDDHRRKSSSMYEVFNWGYSNDEPPKRFSLSIAGSEINIDGPPMASHVPSMNTQAITTSAHRQYTTTTTTTTAIHNNNNSSRKEDFVDTPNIMFRSVYRRKTDLMPTIPSPRDGHYGSRSSLSTTPRTPGSRSGNVTPGGHLNNSRPGSAMSNSTTMSSSGYVNRRPTTAPRKPRPASIAGTGMSLEEINKLKKEQRPPMKTTAASPTSSTAQTTPKRTANPMSTSLIVTSSSSRLSSAEKKTPSKREPVAPKPASAPKALPSRTTSSERISRPGRETRTKDTSAAMTKSMIVTNTVTAAAEQNDTAVAKEPNVKEEEKTNAPAAATPAAAAVEPAQSKAEKEALNSVKTEEVAAPQEIVATQPQTVSAEAAQAQAVDPHTMEEKVDVGNEKEAFQQPQQKLPEQQASANSEKKSSRNGSKENSEVRELTPPAANAEGNDLMTASMIAKKITTEEEAKAALAERRRLAREEAERQAELERQRIEAERLAEIKRQEEEAERQRQFEEEATRLAEEQRRGEEERLRKAIEEAKAREEEEQRKRADEERQRIEREEAEKKAKEDAEKQRVEVAERLKREEKEREERRKRVEAIMSRTRKGGAAAGANTGNTPSSTPAKESNATAQASPPAPKDNEASSESVSNSSSSSNSTGSPGSNPPPTEQTPVMPGEVTLSNESQNTQATYEQSVLDKENSLINSFSSMIIDQNAKNLQQFEVTNGKLLVDFNTSSNTTTAAVANGNGHIENVNNKNDINILQDVVTPAATQLIDLSIESQDLHNNPLNINNNNSLLTNTTATTTLVTADSHENKDISLL
ncbi:MAP7 domain-containing protein 1 isoform X7 [Scaptodrosophila lebanonensis]|uniref:MAP7 domain-containing protein 1 isoform X7 n=1 Tax=Drosophila lebanonensis TaxID=7225 RepID=A0A6J2TZZ5_DROLE|nr:MAP7 domain-containing protein 1 isoform X7 [Scaptodrosophila lebanonensis]